MKNSKGVTLIELVVSITVLAVIILTSVTLLNFGQRTFTSNDKTGQLQTEANYLASMITSQIHESDSIITGTAIQLQLGYKDGTYTNFSVSGNTLTMTDRTGNTTTISTDLSSSSFNVTGGGNGVDIYLTLSSGGQNFKFRTAAYKRF